MSNNGKTITFIQDSVPGLKAGEYTISVSQNVQAGDTPKSYSATRTFAVQGDRFSIQANEVHAIFPPDQDGGEYVNCLPHIIFNRAMLPWLRTLDHQGAKDLPWLALLLFNGTEAPAVQTKQVRDLIPSGRNITVAGSNLTGTGNLPDGYLSYPFNDPQSGQAYELDYGEKPTDPIQTIDLSIDLFNRVAPSESDIEFLAHVREVDTTGKATGTGTGGKGSSLDVGIFSLVIGNRLPQKDTKSVVHLVSLEGMGKYLPDSDGNSHLPNYTGVRLVSLKRWSFSALTDGHALQVALERLNQNNTNEDGSVTTNLRLPGAIPSPQEVQGALQAQNNGTLTNTQASVLVANALGMGYTAMKHQTRAGSQTVSWYRGPLLPFSSSTSQTSLVSYADALTNYNPLTGLFDVSYGTAWQLGQLMALRDKHFATMLYNWKTQFRKTQSAPSHQAAIAQKLASLAESSENDHHQAFARFFHCQLTLTEETGTDEQLTAIANWLIKLRKFYGVPFNYLVPDENMLPVESLRFFYVDPNWLGALTDGALSIGRKPEDLSPEQAILDALEKAEDTGPVISGFLLRSGTVVGWPGIVIQALAGTPDPAGDLDRYPELPRLRWERLSDSLLLAVFNGDVGTVVFHEPKEALHFGVETEGRDLVTTLRNLKVNPGEEMLGQTVEVNVRNDGQTLKVTETASGIHSQLENLQAASDRFTSAEFAVEMVKGSTRVVFQRQ